MDEARLCPVRSTADQSLDAKDDDTNTEDSFPQKYYLMGLPDDNGALYPEQSKVINEN